MIITSLITNETLEIDLMQSRIVSLGRPSEIYDNRSSQINSIIRSPLGVMEPGHIPLHSLRRYTQKPRGPHLQGEECEFGLVDN